MVRLSFPAIAAAGQQEKQAGSMLSFIGLDFLPQETLVGLLIMTVVAAVAVGWISDAIMGSSGYGVVGNGFLTLIGAFTGLAGWRQSAGPLLPRQMPWIIAAAGFGALAILMLFALFKRAVR